MPYTFTKQDDLFSGAPTLTYERDGILFYIAAAEDSGSFECGAMADCSPLSTHQDMTAESAAELAMRLFGLPRITDDEINAIKAEAVEFWG